LMEMEQRRKLLLRQINTNNVRVPHPRHVFVFVTRTGQHEGSIYLLDL
jgi:hypothetical protein